MAVTYKVMRFASKVMRFAPKVIRFASKVIKSWVFSLFFGLVLIFAIFHKLIFPEEIIYLIDDFLGGFLFSVTLNYAILFCSSLLYASTGEVGLPVKERKKSILSGALIFGSTISILKDTAFTDGVSPCSKFIILILLLIPYLIIIGSMTFECFKVILKKSSKCKTNKNNK